MRLADRSCMENQVPRMGKPSPTDKIHQVSLEHNERIVDVELQTGWLIDRITFVSDQGRRFGPFGGNGGAARQIMKPSRDQNGFLKYIKGCVGHSQGGTVICQFQLVWGYYQYDD